jgi:hypothetical protein
MNIVGGGPGGTLVAGTDLAGAYIKATPDSPWQMIAPDNGVSDTHVTGVAFDPSDANIIMLATEGGLYLSVDRGSAFSRADHSPGSSVLYGGKFLTMAYQPSIPDNGSLPTVYASRISRYNVADGKILRSDDGGNSFVQTADLIAPGNPGADNIAITKIVIHPDNPDVVLVLAGQERALVESGLNTINALYMSADKGNTWTRLAQGIANISDIAFNPVAPYHVFISSVSAEHQSRVYYAVADAGNDDWQLAFTTPAFDSEFYSPVLMLWPDSTGSRSMRVIDINSSYHFQASAGWRVFNNTDSAVGWQHQSLGQIRDWTGDESNWKMGWSRVFSILSPTLESINHTIGFDLSDPDRILWATNQFVFSADQVSQGGDRNTLQFNNLTTTGNVASGWASSGLDNITPFILDVNAQNSNVIYAGLNDLGCTVSHDKGASWKLCIHNTDSWEGSFHSAISYGGVASALISDPGDAQTVWMFAAGDQDTDVVPLRSTTSGSSWTSFLSNWEADSNPSTPDVYGLSIDPLSSMNARRLYVTVAGAVYRSEDSGQHWQEVNECNFGCRVTEVASNGSVYAGGEAGLFVSTDHGASWSTVLTGSHIGGHYTDFVDNEKQQVFDRGGWSGVSGMAIDPLNPDIIYVAVFDTGYEQGIYKCNLSGGINTDNSCLATPLHSAYVRDVAIDPSNSQNLFATSSSAYTSGGFLTGSTGVWRSTDGATSWQAFNNGLDWNMAFVIEFDPTNGNLVYTGSPGGGNYRIDLADGESQPSLLHAPSGNTPASRRGNSAGTISPLLFFPLAIVICMRLGVLIRSNLPTEFNFFCNR